MRAYKDAAGRFPISTGTGDDGVENRSFYPEEKGGEYKHKLTPDEMPEHTHDYQAKERTMLQSGSATQVWYGQQTIKTGPAGKDMPHNNMPPYLRSQLLHKIIINPVL